ncbi:MAG TPA: elongation factor P [Syntrophorhabdus sp.]|nr:elongation factor P [Syntrophorhabdus sp.]OPX98370.1 MAG: Elongation factor P [Syntrophorhabdus sp. PtaB.Bin027]OQB75284.1 MAG: Elongation factor P [Deltaproteobacteria bacterium ADurb.Bin135]MBP8743555.1 elongation factor P [Syntrophorhabdus sp.]HNQ45893.1 elongation factor P [Syntrophorhabdus sp.]
MMVSTSEFRKGLRILLEDEPFVIVDFQHVKPGKGGAFVRTRIKSLISGNVLDRTFRSGDKVDLPELEESQMQFLYSEEDKFYFMDTNTYDQIFIDEKNLGDAKNYIKEGLTIEVLFYKGNPIGVEIQNFVDLKIVKTEPGVRGDTATNVTKPALLESGYTIQVPLFVEEGEVVKIDTRTGQYIERVSK